MEAEGWSLFDVSYVFQHRGSITQERFIYSGAREVVSGRILGTYLFRASGAPQIPPRPS
jgi:hypothetical protein